MRIEYVDYAIGSRFSDHIELNRNLIYYPKLYQKVLKHELGHRADKIFSWHDLKHDLFDFSINPVEMIWFCSRHPKSLVQFFPFYWTNKHGFVYDPNLCLGYTFLFIIIGGAIIW